MKQLMVVIFMVSFVAAAEHHKGKVPNAEQIQQAQVQAGPVGAALAEIKDALRQPKTLTLLTSIAALHLAFSYGDWSPESVLLLGGLKYLAGAAVCGRHMPDMCVLGAGVALAGAFWYQYAAIFWGIQEWIIERSGGKDFGIAGNLGVALAERTASYFNLGGRGKK